MMWRKAPTSRIEMPEYEERGCLEAFVNALVHRSYLELGSAVHTDIFDDRMTIYSPGGMVDGSIIQNQKLSAVSSKRRNPVLADVFARLGYMENDREADLRRSSNGIMYVRTIQRRKCLLSHLLLHNSL